MKNNSPAKNSVAARNLKTRQRVKLVHLLSMLAVFALFSLAPSVSPLAQKTKEGPVKLTGVSSRQTGEGTVITVTSESPLSRAQTWQDEEGFHLSLINAGPGALKNLPRGVTVRNLGKSMEIVVAVKNGANVTVDPQSNHLNLIVKGGVNTAKGGIELTAPVSAPSAETPAYDPSYDEQAARLSRGRPSQIAPAGSFPSVNRDYQQPWPTPSSAPAPDGGAAVAPTPSADATVTSPVQTGNGSQAGQAPQLASPTDGSVDPAQANPASPEIVVTSPTASSDGGIMSYLLTPGGVVFTIILGVVALWIVRRRRAAWEEIGEVSKENAELIEEMDEPQVALAALEERPKKERRRRSRRQSDQSLVRAGGAGVQEVAGVEGGMERRVAAPVQPALYGAYRVDQEVGKLVLGQPHRLDVLASRAPDDRRAIETSLIKVINSPEAGEDGQRRACTALEEYGFVARQCASLLLSYDAYDRASAARVLGEIRAQSSLPFLMEALYDVEAIVRTEAITSIGSLKMPTAIGALLDMARRHPEMPASLLSNALSACSLECMDIFDISTPDRLLLEAGDGESFATEFTHLDSSSAVEALPEWFENEEMSEALARLEEADVEARASAARRLAQFPVRCSVEALTLIAANDVEPVVRSAAVTSLGEIEHESVFAPVLMAFADESREVCAAAARALSRMNLDRADAYVRLLETADVETLRKVSVACIKAGMAAQALDRLISEDRRLAYEAFSLLSLLAKSNETEMLLDAVSDHLDTNVRLAVVRLLGSVGQPEVATHLRHLAVREGMPEKVRSSLLEVVYKLDQTVEVKA